MGKKDIAVIVDERTVTYIHSLETENSPLLEEMEAYAHKEFVPIIRKEMESFLQNLIYMTKPKRILEVGTAIGYSALIMAEAMPEDCRITTIENYEKRIPIAKANFEKSEKGDRITLIYGDAMEILPGLEAGFDFIFMDAAKGQYINFLPEIDRLLSKGGVLVSDNVLQDGDLIESRYGIEKRNRTIHSRMREYLYTLKHSDQVVTSVIPLGDGVALTYKK